MIHRNDDYARVPEMPPAMAGGQRPSDALVLGGAVPPPPASLVAGPPLSTLHMPAPPSVLNGGMDRDWFLNSLRRRWILALCMGVVLATAAAGGLWFMFPESSSAEALFHADSEPQNLVFEGVDRETRRFEVFQRTQLTYLQSPHVLQAALTDPQIAQLSTFIGVDDKIRWLQENLLVQFPQQGELLQIRLSGSGPPDELRLIVDAVAQAYMDEVILRRQNQKLRTLDILTKAYDLQKKEVEAQLRKYLLLAKDLGNSAALGQDSESQLLYRQIVQDMGKRNELEEQRSRLQLQFQINQRIMKDPQVVDQMLDQAVEADPMVQGLRSYINSIDMQMTVSQAQSGSRGSGRGANRRMQEMRAGLEQQLTQYRAQLRQQMKLQRDMKPDVNQKVSKTAFRYQNALLNSQIAELDESITQNTEKLLARDEKSVELALELAEYEQISQIAHDMKLRIDSWEVELDAPDRITLVQPAYLSEDINTKQRYTIAGMGGIATFALTCFGIAYMEFRNRRLNGPSQLDEGLGIRVVGTLPSLSNRRLAGPTDPVVAQLTDSIDGVRTLLMHDSASKPRRVVLVTSAATSEGRTTVSSQLAASLARAGRRTLLVDGDLRRPALHALFDVPLEDGLAEVLRAEVDLADVIRPTHAEGLWLLTAGYCDVDAIHALATDQLQPIFDKLRADYDFVIVDGAPVLGLSDSLVIGQYCDGAILSVLRDQSEVPKIHQAAELLRGVGIRLIGSVVNGVSTRSDQRVTQLRLTAPKNGRKELQGTSA